MLHFSDRLKIVKLFNVWRAKDGIAPTAANMLVFLMTNGLLNEDALRALLEKENVKLVHEEE